MAVGGILLDATGRRFIDSAGRLVLSNDVGDECCCGKQCPGCAPTSQTITLVVSGFTQARTCSAVRVGASFYYFSLLADSGFNHTYGLTRQSVVNGITTYSMLNRAGIVRVRPATIDCAALTGVEFPYFNAAVTFDAKTCTTQASLWVATLNGADNLYERYTIAVAADAESGCTSTSPTGYPAYVYADGSGPLWDGGSVEIGF